MNEDILQEIMATTNWSDIDSLRKKLEESGYFTPEFLSTAMRNAKNQAIRSALNKHKDADGLPKYVSIIRTNDKGKKERVYKQETLFDMGDYKQVVRYRYDRVRHEVDVTKIYISRAFARFGERIQLSFDFEDKAKKAKR